MKLAMVAFDGLDPRIVMDKDNDLPNLQGFMEDSMHGEWTTPGHTIPSFTATLTGRQYNVTNFHWDEGRGDYQRHRQTGFDYLWDIIDSSMTIVNSPVLYPPEEIDDVMICGFLTPDSLTEQNLARPMEVQKILNERDYIPDIPADDTYDKLGQEGMLDLLSDMMMKRVDISEYLIEEYDSDLFYGVWTSTDRWFHQCHKHGHDYMPLYHAADAVTGEMLNIIPDDVPIIMFSDHGFAHFPYDEGVHKGHMYRGWYSVNHENIDGYRDDSASIFDLFPTIVNYLGGEVPEGIEGRVLLHTESQEEQVESRLRDLGYLE